MRKLTWKPEVHLALQHGRAVLPPINLVTQKWRMLTYFFISL